MVILSGVCSGGSRGDCDLSAHTEQAGGAAHQAVQERALLAAHPDPRVHPQPADSAARLRDGRYATSLRRLQATQRRLLQRTPCRQAGLHAQGGSCKYLHGNLIFLRY